MKRKFAAFLLILCLMLALALCLGLALPVAAESADEQMKAVTLQSLTIAEDTVNGR